MRAHTYAHAQANMRVHVWHTRMYASMNISVRACALEQMCSCAHVCMCVRTHISMRTCARTLACKHNTCCRYGCNHTYTPTHTYTHLPQSEAVLLACTHTWLHEWIDEARDRWVGTCNVKRLLVPLTMMNGSLIFSFFFSSCQPPPMDARMHVHKVIHMRAHTYTSVYTQGYLYIEDGPIGYLYVRVRVYTAE